MPDTLTMSRTAPAPDVPAAFASSERANLAACIDRHRQLAAHLDDTRKRASAGIHARLKQAYDDRAAAEAALREAAGSAAEQALARALGGAGPTVAQLEAELKAARDRFDATWSDRELIGDEIARLARAVDSAHEAVQQAVSAVLAASPGWAALLAELASTRRYILILENTIAELHKLPAVRLPNDWGTPAIRSKPDDYLPDPEILARWRDAIVALTADATAPLPGGNPAPQPVAA